MHHVLGAGDRTEDPVAVHRGSLRYDSADASRSPARALASSRPVMIVSFRQCAAVAHPAYIDVVCGGK